MSESRFLTRAAQSLAVACIVAVSAIGLDAGPADAAGAAARVPAAASSSSIPPEEDVPEGAEAPYLVEDPAIAEQFAISSSTINRDPTSPLVLASRKYPIQPSRYVPKLSHIGSTGYRATPETATAYRKMAYWAKQDGVRMRVTSAYRSYDTQKALYDRYVRLYGEAYAKRISALPGTSEHQLGFAIDVGDSSGQCGLQDCFENTATGKWVKKNAHKYGFIVRYPKAWESVTGYKYEPWHLRYVGTTAATRIYKNKIPTLEHYSGALGPWVTQPTHRTVQKVWIRKSGSIDAPRVRLLQQGAKISVTGSPKNGWYPVLYTSPKYGRAQGWLKARTIWSYKTGQPEG
ncbi:hypothetical protein BJH93_14765 [Kocuria polaris]|nr:hypothetical protein [Kocuria polaris]